jgi:peptidylprolyl isomerase
MRVRGMTLGFVRFARIAALGLALVGLAPTAHAQNKENMLIMQTSEGGPVVIEMRPDLAPKTVAHIKELVRKKFYDGVVFHRVIAGFMAQTGDPTGTGTGGSPLGKIKAEFNIEPHVRGTVSMARSSDPDSADSQFFICYAPVPSLDRQYTVWGKVISGMEYIDKIKKGAGQSGMVSGPDKIVSLRVAADAQ